MIRFTRRIPCAAAASSAFAQGGADQIVRIGCQKARLSSILKRNARTRVKPLGYDVQWFGFPAGASALTPCRRRASR
ncbi:hypothetical protein J4G50_27855 [Burkholderia anthina]|nr:hypothetical protein [Burkholderia anthina]QTD92061.1 hypothetical protein J4G50_27855 [Burkholderia anthina]